jgi:hypothetical protein
MRIGHAEERDDQMDNEPEIPVMPQVAGESERDYQKRCAAWAIRQSTEDGEVDRAVAARLVEQLVRQNPHLLYLLVKDQLAKACWALISRYHAEIRRELWPEMVSAGQRIIRGAADTESALDELPTLTLKPLPSEVARGAQGAANTSMYAGIGKSVLDTYTILGRGVGVSILLGDARKSDLRYAITEAETRVRGNLKHVLLLRQIEERLIDDVTRVRAVVDEADVARYSANAEQWSGTMIDHEPPGA